MPRLRFGAFLAPHHPIGEHPMLQFRRDLDLVEQLDRLGYDEFWCGEHHSSGWEMIASPEMFLAAGEHTSRIKLATGVVSLPYHHPFNVAQRKLTSEGMDPATISAIREEMERAQARRLQPHFISAFFREAFPLLGGRIIERERGRFEITRVPSLLKERDRLIGRGDPLLDRYARVTFDKTLINGQPQAELLAPGHPLLDAAVDVVLERFQPLLGQGAVLVDDADPGTAPRLLLYLEHAIRDGRTARSGEPRVISQRLQFILLDEGGSAADAGAAPYLDYRTITADERARVADVLSTPWLADGVKERAIGYAIANLVPAHLAEVRSRRHAEIDKVEREVRARLTREINYWDARAARLREEERAGKEQRINAVNAEAMAQRLVERLHTRQQELDRERQITALPPVLKGAVLVIPAGFPGIGRACPSSSARVACCAFWRMSSGCCGSSARKTR